MREASKMRWYDIEPDVYMAISMIECAKPEEQVDYAKYIINKLKEEDTEMLYIKNAAKEKIHRKYQRWYDKNETTSMAFEYLKHTTKDIQKNVALSVLEYMKNLAAIA